jgi:hypothetical protein
MDARTDTARAVGEVLTRLTDHELAERVDGAMPLGTGIGGTSKLLKLDGVPVFVKRVPLTDLERRPELEGSTANIFGLPTFIHYGLGSVGGGAWRELAVHTMTTEWVLAGEHEGFPLLYHWRVLPAPPRPAPTTEARDQLDRMVEFWHGSEAVRARLEAIEAATADLVLFIEYVPDNLHDWLARQFATGDEATIQHACELAERGLADAVAFMATKGLLHFDAHGRNVLTDGRRLYLTDFGLATSTSFDLSAEEREFVALNRRHDEGHTVTDLINWIVRVQAGVREWKDRIEYVRRCAAGRRPTDLPRAVADLVMRRAAVAVVMSEFYWRLYHTSRATPFPAEELDLVTSNPLSPRIVAVEWGRMEVEGVGTVKDAKLFPGGGREWDWSETGTRHDPGIQPADVQELLDHGATAIVLSRGMELRLRVDPATLALLEERGVTVYVAQTPDAVRVYNDLARHSPVGGLFHSTC